MMKEGDDMKNSILSIGLALAVLATSAFGAGQKMTCRVTGKTMDNCCCEIERRQVLLQADQENLRPVLLRHEMKIARTLA